ncbi:MAG: penicillin acylase family protein, partial [Candidatus Obscuribacterales bacterium]|nr:penicillin acylase family protein [Steroidobacteraceae bacterium]
MLWVKRAALALLSLIAAIVIAAYFLWRGSLPLLDGEIAVAEITDTARIERDALGVVTITANSRDAVAFATGYAHAQDRWFQMDLMRRVGAGELAELLGAEFIERDKSLRRHAFRQVAGKVIALATPAQRQLLDAYVAGVNAAREAFSVRSFEYLLLQSEPAPWRSEDSLLVAFAMYIDLNDSRAAFELERARLHASLPQAVFDFLYPRATEWDAPLDGIELTNVHVAIPGPEIIDLRKNPLPVPTHSVTSTQTDYPGSNNWAIAGTRTTTGAAVLANDMHLSLRLAHIWYRARLVVNSDDQSIARDLIGLTLPGLPVLVAGSNRHIAWGFTNTHGDFDDLVLIDSDAKYPNRYRTGEKYSDYVTRRERINVRNGTAIEVEYRDTIWGPLIEEQLDGKPLAIAWTAHQPQATNLRQLELEAARSVEQALVVANTAGIPAQNFLVADSAGNIGWTLIGQLPKRHGFNGELPACWGCDSTVGWHGWLTPEEFPRIVNPPDGQLWSANSRTLGGAAAALIG